MARLVGFRAGMAWGRTSVMPTASRTGMVEEEVEEAEGEEEEEEVVVEAEAEEELVSSTMTP